LSQVAACTLNGGQRVLNLLHANGDRELFQGMTAGDL
jgi:hypothetical protein